MKRLIAVLLVAVMLMTMAISGSAAENTIKLSGKYLDNKTKLSFTWNAIDGAERYYLQRKSPDDKKYTTLWNTTGLQLLDVPPEAGIKYTYRIAVKISDKWIYSNKLMATLKTKPTYPNTATVDIEKAKEKSDELRYYDMTNDPTYAEDYVFPYKVGEMPGNVSEYIEKFSKSCNGYANERFWQTYGFSILNSNLGLKLIDYVDTDGVVKLYKASEYKTDPSLYEKSHEYLENYGTVKLITDTKAIPNNSVALFKSNKASSKDGHYVFIEYVERDKDGNPITVYYTEANGRSENGVINKCTFNEFINRSKHSDFSLKGYLIPHTLPKGK